jgi:hypothetical protein
MKKVVSLLILLLCVLTSISTSAQKGKSKESVPVVPVISPQDMDSLKKYELALKEIADSMIDGQRQFTRIKATVKFIPMMVKAFCIPMCLMEHMIISYGKNTNGYSRKSCSRISRNL